MDKLEKVIKGLESCLSPGHDCPLDCSYGGNCRGDELYRDALEVLKRLEPIEPMIVAGQYECGECRYELRADADSYCPCCGKKVKWNE